jgi:hypothetical protein
MLTPEELAAAKRALAKGGRPPMNTLSREDQNLLQKYPRHTLEQAREIDGTPAPGCPIMLGITSGFEKIIAQERGNFHLSGDHT